MELDVRPVFTALVGDAPSPITADANARVDAIVDATRDALTTARRLGVTELGTSSKPLYVQVTADPMAATTPYFLGDDTLLLGTTPISDRARRFLDQASGAQVRAGASWLDVDLGTVVPHEVGHGVLGELLPQVQRPTAACSRPPTRPSNTTTPGMRRRPSSPMRSHACEHATTRSTCRARRARRHARRQRSSVLATMRRSRWAACSWATGRWADARSGRGGAVRVS